MTFEEQLETMLRERTAAFPVRLRQGFSALLTREFPPETHLLDIEVDDRPLTNWFDVDVKVFNPFLTDILRIPILTEADDPFSQEEADTDAFEEEVDINEIEFHLLKEMVMLAWKEVGGKKCRFRLYIHQHDSCGGYDALTGDFFDDDERFAE